MEQVKAEPVACPFCGGKDIRTMIGVRSERGFSMLCGGCGIRQGSAGRTKAEAIAAWNQRATPQPAAVDGLVERAFTLGDRVTKTKGSSWTGLVVGFYSTSLTPEGYAVESENEPGSVQIYPRSALAQIERKPEDGNG